MLFGDPALGNGGKCRLELDTGGYLYIEPPANMVGGGGENGSATKAISNAAAVETFSLPAKYTNYRWAVIAHRAEGLHDLSTFTPMDPYLMVG